MFWRLQFLVKSEKIKKVINKNISHACRGRNEVYDRNYVPHSILHGIMKQPRKNKEKRTKSKEQCPSPRRRDTRSK